MTRARPAATRQPATLHDVPGTPTVPINALPINALPIDALLPAAIAHKAEDLGVTKANMALPRMFALGVLAGSFISLGALLSTTVTAGGEMAPGISRLLAGLVFSLGLILVVVGGAELFTGNTLLVMAAASKRLSITRVGRCWIVVYVGNFVGALATASLVIGSGVLESNGGAVGQRAVAIAYTKSSLTFSHALISGVLANALVCLAVWMSMSARSVTDKVIAVVPPVTAFVAIGLEHSIANMYFIPVALLHRAWGDTAGIDSSISDLSWTRFLGRNLLPVTIGNIIGGGILVWLTYWFIYLRKPDGP
jgi:formate transporter